MKKNTIYILTFLSLFLLTNCSDSNEKKKSETTETEVTSQTKDSIKNAETLKDLDEEIDAMPHHYICYTNDDKSSMQLSIAFDSEGNAKFVKYRGQKDSILLKNVKEDYNGGGAYPTITQFYDEIYNGEINGTYELTHSGNWDYAKYTREKDGKVFKFTIDHDLTVTEGNYRNTPCFSETK